MPSTKWLLCNGQAVSRTTYSSLFLRLGTVFGAGDNSTTFQLPNFTDRSPIGAGAQYTAGLETGSKTVALTEAQVPLKAHYHGTGRRAGGGAIDDANNDFDFIMRTWSKTGTYHYNTLQGDTGLTGNGNFSDTGTAATSGPIEDTAGTAIGGTHEIVHPSLGIYFIIKAL
jgi:microcystin-dependent protein